jgi:hypothetical protein
LCQASSMHGIRLGSAERGVYCLQLYRGLRPTSTVHPGARVSQK